MNVELGSLETGGKIDIFVESWSRGLDVRRTPVFKPAQTPTTLSRTSSQHEPRDPFSIARSFCAKILKTVTTIIDQASSEEVLKNDRWKFYLAPEVANLYQTTEALYKALKERQNFLVDLREKTRKTLDPIPALEDVLATRLYQGTYILSSGLIQPPMNGISGSYFLLNRDQKPVFIVKPLDEEAGCINNPKGYATPLSTNLFREHLPLYLSVFRERATFEIAEKINIHAVVPKTDLAILESYRFFDLSQQIQTAELGRYRRELGPINKEKLCSVQEYISGSKPLFEALQQLQELGLDDEEIANRFDEQDFEEANLLLWSTYDVDGHAANFLVYPKSFDEIGNEKWGLKKIDNGMTFPEQNQGLSNALSYLPNAKRPLSEKTRAKIREMDIDKLGEILRANNLAGAIPAMRDRIFLLKSLINDPTITIKKINKNLESMHEKPF